ncbi:MAG: cysteine desulfurase family protein [Candidatus Hadarchaeota archaeon]
MEKNLIYMDNSASTKVDDRVVEVMEEYMTKKYAVATSEFAYSLGIKSGEALKKARSEISKELGASPEEFIFTSGATESSNLALKGAARAQRNEGKHLIISKIEDFPVLNSAKSLEKNEGFDVTYLEVDREGFVDIEQLKDEIRTDTTLISIQHANQEIGTIQDIKAVSDIASDYDAVLHTDATHTFTRIPLDVDDLGLDMATVSAHTIHGPKGIGGLFVRSGTPIQKMMDGGFQEDSLRAGVENIPGAVGFSKAVNLMSKKENDRLRKIRDRIIDKILSNITDVTLNGSRENRTPHNANITFHGVEGESITLHLDMNGFAVSTGSACFSRSLEASHVIMGIGGDHERAHGSVRFSLGRFNDMEEVESLVNTLSEIIEKLRNISPLKRGGGMN